VIAGEGTLVIISSGWDSRADTADRLTRCQITFFEKPASQELNPERAEDAGLRKRTWLEAKGYSSPTINQCVAAIRKLAKEAAANGWLAQEIAGGITAIPGIKQ
jgi:hypothetical protein